MSIEICCRGFSNPLSDLNGNHQLSGTVDKLFLAALTCGYDGFFTSSHPNWDRRVQHITGNVSVFLVDLPDKNIALSSYYFEIDSSENKHGAYYIGQGLTKLFAEQMLRAPIVMHASRSRWNPTVGSALKAPALTVGRKEADLFAFGPGGVHVLESKGRTVRNGVGRLTNSTMNAAMTQALGQVSAIETVNQIAPLSRSGCVWTLCTSGVRGDIQDPPGDGLNATVSDIEILRSNYALFLDASPSQFRTDRIPGYSLVELPSSDGSGIYLGILTEILWAVASRQATIPGVVSLATSAQSRLLQNPAAEYLGDGTLIYRSARDDRTRTQQVPPVAVALGVTANEAVESDDEEEEEEEEEEIYVYPKY
ncbi:hypothetical protein LJR251_002095 [Rhizobium rhizogenes]|uniref:hypothetical protein n=1 Tax=Rhizobium rhizogenes TaxID=359 RepID=UPI003ED0FE6B